MDKKPASLVPMIAVTADVGGPADYPAHSAPESYLRGITHGLRGVPLIVPAMAGEVDIDALLGRVDGVLVTGARSNVHPSRYGVSPSPVSEPYDERRDATSLPLIRAAIDKGVPLFAICRGMQELNVALGGSLDPRVHELPGRADHRGPAGGVDDRFAIRQSVAIVPGGCLARILGPGEVKVNSVHHQGVARLAERLAIEAAAPDGTIEAVSVKDAPGFAVGVQWHPEYWVASDEPSARLFEAFGEAVRERMRGQASAASGAGGRPSG